MKDTRRRPGTYNCRTRGLRQGLMDGSAMHVARLSLLPPRVLCKCRWLQVTPSTNSMNAFATAATPYGARCAPHGGSSGLFPCVRVDVLPPSQARGRTGAAS